MKYAVKQEIDGETKYEVAEGADALQAIDQCIFEHFASDKDKDPVYTGVYEIGRTNLMQEAISVAEFHNYYKAMQKNRGIDASVFEDQLSGHKIEKEM